MGTICCKSPRDPTWNNDVKHANTPFPPLPAKIVHTDLVNLIGLDNINKYFQEDALQLENKEFQNDKELLFDGNLDSIKTYYKLWTTFTTQPENNYQIHNHRHQMAWPFTPRYHYLFDLQEKLTHMGKDDDSLEYHRILATQTTKDTIIQVFQFKTKKVLIIQPRHFLVVRIIRRKGPNEFESCSRTLNLTPLAKIEDYANILAQEENDAIIHNGTSKLTKEGDRNRLDVFNKMDFLSSVGKKLAASQFKKKFPAFFSKQAEKMIEFLFARVDHNEIIWFEGSKNEIQSIIDENIKLLKELHIDLRQFDKTPNTHAHEEKPIKKAPVKVAQNLNELSNTHHQVETEAIKVDIKSNVDRDGKRVSTNVSHTVHEEKVKSAEPDEQNTELKVEEPPQEEITGSANVEEDKPEGNTDKGDKTPEDIIKFDYVEDKQAETQTQAPEEKEVASTNDSLPQSQLETEAVKEPAKPEEILQKPDEQEEIKIQVTKNEKKPEEVEAEGQLPEGKKSNLSNKLSVNDDKMDENDGKKQKRKKSRGRTKLGTV